MHWLLPDPARFELYVLSSCFIFPVFHALVLRFNRKPVTLGSMVIMIVLGFSFPGFLFLALSAIDPAFLAEVSDQNLLLVMTGVIGMFVGIFELFRVKP